VLLPHGLRQHLGPERFVKVRRGGKVSGDVDLAFLLGAVDGGWRSSRIDSVDGGWSGSRIDSVHRGWRSSRIDSDGIDDVDSVDVDGSDSRIDTVSDAQRAPLCTESASAGTPHRGTS
jgi:hypothetical protein